MQPTRIVKHFYQNRQIAQDYDGERFSSFSGRIFDYLEKRAIERAIQDAQRKNCVSTVLDIPCGTGRITEWFLKRGFSVLGGDISQEMMAVGRIKLASFSDHVTFRQLDLDHLDLPNSSYDLVSCIRLFHHLETNQRTAVLRELARVSRKYVLVNVSYSSLIYRQRRRLKQWLRQGVSRTSSTWAEIQCETRDSGLQVVSYHFIFPLVSEDLVLLLERSGELQNGRH
jgi:ubiquinone/menaquinone biosynthesis C-methylase UbiE